MEVYWADISRAGKLKDRFYENDRDGAQHFGKGPHIEHSVIAAHTPVPAGETRSVRFAIGWYVPNFKKKWVSQFAPLAEKRNVKPIWKNYYATQWNSVEHVLADTFGQWDSLVARTTEFRDSLSSSTYPVEVVDAVSANLSIIKSPTSLRLDDGTFYGWEGCHPDAGCCEGSCTHVWNYQQVLPFLYPELERSMRDADFLENQDPNTGGMAFRLALPKGIGISTSRPCVDGQFGAVLKVYRDWKLNGDTEWLHGIWQNVAAAIEFAWNGNNYDKWDPNQSGVISGRQHHTLDMELFGANSWLTGIYLAGLSAGAQLAQVVGDSERARTLSENLSTRQEMDIEKPV